LLQQRFQLYFSYTEWVCVGFVVDEVTQRQVHLQVFRFSHVNSLLQCHLFLSEEQVGRAMESTQSITRFWLLKYIFTKIRWEDVDRINLTQNMDNGKIS